MSSSAPIVECHAVAHLLQAEINTQRKLQQNICIYVSKKIKVLNFC